MIISVLQMSLPGSIQKVCKVSKYTEELYKKGLNDPDNHHGVITHLEPDILECKVKWVFIRPKIRAFVPRRKNGATQ